MNHDLFAPQAGAIVRCWFPQSESVFEPGEKFRPVLLMQARRREDGGLEVFVAYGTSQAGAGIGPGDLLVRQQAGLALREDTKFRLAKACWLPLTAEWFCGKSGPLSLGLLPVELYREFRRAAIEVGLA